MSTGKRADQDPTTTIEEKEEPLNQFMSNDDARRTRYNSPYKTIT